MDIGSSKKLILGILKKAFRLRDWHIDDDNEALKQIFRKRKSFFNRLEYCFVVEGTEIKNAPFQYKTALSEDNIKIDNTMGSTTWTYHKE